MRTLKSVFTILMLSSLVYAGNPLKNFSRIPKDKYNLLTYSLDQEILNIYATKLDVYNPVGYGTFYFTGNIESTGTFALTGTLTVDRITVSTAIAPNANGLFLLEDGGSGIFIEDGGFVGIGTNDPIDIMHVQSATGYGFWSAGDQFNTNYGVNADVNTAINYNGYQGGASKFRGLNIFNGKNQLITSFIPSTLGVIFYGNINTNNQWLSGDGDSEGINIDDNGSVGIGTTAPTGEFDVTKSGGQLDVHFVQPYTHATPPILYFDKARGNLSVPLIIADNDGVGDLRFRAFDGVVYQGVATIGVEIDGGVGAGDTPGRMFFSTALDGGSSPSKRMTILNNGKIGIGTTNPGQLLEVYAADGESDNGEVGKFSNLEASADRSFGVIINAGSTSVDYNLKCQDYTLSDTLFIVRGDGSVGIGTSAPSETLEVNGTSKFGGIIDSDNNWISGDGGTEGIMINDSGYVSIGTTTFNAMFNVYANDGVSDNREIANFKNLEGTINRCYGVLIQAGSSAVDYSFKCIDHDANNTLFEVDGLGVGYFLGALTAASYADNTPYPKSKKEAYDAVLSMEGLNGEVNHKKLHKYLKVEKEKKKYNPVTKSTDTVIQINRNVSTSVSALNEVVKDLIERIEKLEKKNGGG